MGKSQSRISEDELVESPTAMSPQLIDGSRPEAYHIRRAADGREGSLIRRRSSIEQLRDRAPQPAKKSKDGGYPHQYKNHEGIFPHNGGPYFEYPAVDFDYSRKKAGGGAISNLNVQPRQHRQQTLASGAGYDMMQNAAAQQQLQPPVRRPGWQRYVTDEHKALQGMMYHPVESRSSFRRSTELYETDDPDVWKTKSFSGPNYEESWGTRPKNGWKRR